MRQVAFICTPSTALGTRFYDERHGEIPIVNVYSKLYQRKRKADLDPSIYLPIDAFRIGVEARKKEREEKPTCESLLITWRGTRLRP